MDILLEIISFIRSRFETSLLYLENCISSIFFLIPLVRNLLENLVRNLLENFIFKEVLEVFHNENEIDETKKGQIQ